jgi:hypothetical protein
MQRTASSVVFVAMETGSNNSPSSSGAFRVATGTCSAKPRPLYLVMTYVGVLILYLILGLNLFKIVFMSRRYDTGFPDAYRILEGADVF